MAEVLVTPRARQDIDSAIAILGLPANTWTRVVRRLRILEEFPRAGRALEGRWEGTRFLVGPWPWMIFVYLHVEENDTVAVLAVHDARSSTAATGAR